MIGVASTLKTMIAIVVLILMGVITAFFVVLDAHKNEIWKEIHKKYIKEDDE